MNELQMERVHRPSWRRWLFGVGTAAIVGALVVVNVQARRRAPAEIEDAPETPVVKGRTVSISEALKERLGLKTAPVEEGTLVPVVTAMGTVTFDPEYVGAIGVRMRGVVSHLYKFEGDDVKKGDLLGDVISSELGAAQANVLMFQAQVESAELNAKREADLAAHGLTTSREVEEAAAENAAYRSKLLAAQQHVSALGGAAVRDRKVRAIGLHQLRSPIDGTVVEQSVSPGQSVEPHQTALRVANLDHLWVELAVYERDLSSVARGDRVELSPLSQHEKAISGEVAHVGEVIEPDTRAGHVRVEIENSKRLLRAGQAVSAKIHATAGRLTSVLQVPNDAVTFIDGKAIVFVAEGPLTYTATPVAVGQSDGESRQVVSGVEKGDTIVTGGVFGLKSELFR